MIQLGDKVRRKIRICDPAAESATPTETNVAATVVYIHPKRRFYTIECEMPGGRSFRETEYFYPRCGMYKT